MSTKSSESDKKQDALWLSLVAQGGRAGDQAMHELYKRYRGPLTARLLKLRATPEVAEDAVQEAFIKAFRAAGKFRGDSAVSSWLHAIAENCLKTIWRERKSEVSLDDVESNDDGGWISVGTSVETPTTCAIRPDIQKSIHDCLHQAYAAFAKAYPREADAIYRKLHHDWSNQDMAHFLQRTENATKEFLSQCRKKMKAFVKPCRDLLGETA